MGGRLSPQAPSGHFAGPLNRSACCRAVEVEVSPARLGLARVSVVRGAGERVGEPCIDDYIQAVEPVHDYLTKWSGLVRPESMQGTANLS